LPRDLLKRAHKYLKRRQRRAPELLQLQQKREEAEKARAEALEAQRNAQKEREEYTHKLAEIERQKREAEELRNWRASLRTNDNVWVPKYDKHGKIARIDHKRGIAVVSLGLGQWEVTFDEIFPEKRDVQ
jgi:DNA mismatch repair protein MutS2